MVLQGLFVLMCFQLLGELVSKAALPFIPGPVLGLCALLAVCLVLGRVPGVVAQAGQGILNHLSLLFIPASVGVVSFLPLLQTHVWAVLLALLVSVACTIAVTAWVLKKLAGPEAEP